MVGNVKSKDFQEISRSLPKNEWIILITCVQEPVEIGVQMKVLMLMSLLSDCGRSVPLPRLRLGDPLARRSFAKAGTERGRLPPATAGLEVTRP